MVLTPLDIKDKSFNGKFRGYSIQEVDEFLDIVTRDYEEILRQNQENETKIKMLTERLAYFDEMKESLSQSVILAQDTAEKLKATSASESQNIIKQAEHDAQFLLETAKAKANEMLRHATDNAKRVAVETEELKNKARIFHQRLKSTIESQLAIVDSSEWEEILRPTATYLQTSDEAFREVVSSALEEEVHVHEEDSLDMTRQLSPEDLAEIARRAEEANQELEAYQATQNLNRQEITDAVNQAAAEPVDLY